MRSSPRHMGEDAQLDLGIVPADEQIAGGGDEGFPDLLPRAVRTGMFCRFGSALEIRPVEATVWLNRVCTLPSEPRAASRPSIYVDFSLVSFLYSSTRSATGCREERYSRVSASVE